jgi:hypothetical protein
MRLLEFRTTRRREVSLGHSARRTSAAPAHSRAYDRFRIRPGEPSIDVRRRPLTSAAIQNVRLPGSVPGGRAPIFPLMDDRCQLRRRGLRTSRPAKKGRLLVRSPQSARFVEHQEPLSSAAACACASMASRVPLDSVAIEIAFSRYLVRAPLSNAAALACASSTGDTGEGESGRASAFDALGACARLSNDAACACASAGGEGAAVCAVDIPEVAARIADIRSRWRFIKDFLHYA